MASNKEWTTKEIAILFRIHQSGISATEQMHLLPGRSLASARQTMRAQDWGKKPHGKSTVKRPFTKRRGKDNLKRFLAVVREFGPLTADEIADRSGICITSTYALCKFAHRGATGKLIHVAAHTESGIETKYAQRKWSIGDLPDVESNSLTARQRRQIAKEESALEFAQMKERDFAPRRDPLVSAFFGSAA